MQSTRSSLALQSTISSQGRFELKLTEVQLRPPAADEVIVQMEAAPINPADLLGIFGPVDKATLTLGGTSSAPTLQGEVPLSRLSSVKARLDVPVFLGNEGAGTVVDAGEEVRSLLGRKVAIRDQAYSQFRLLKASECLVLPKDVTSREGAAARINPFTALSMVETMKRESHKAIVHTAAASSVGQMLNRLCLKDNIGLVNIVRGPHGFAVLREAGAKYVLDSTSKDFQAQLVDALIATEATIAFDAIGGGPLVSQILAAMEIANSRNSSFSRYGSSILKQIYVYGLLDPGPKVIEGSVGTAWSVGGWLMSWSLEKFGAETVSKMNKRVADELMSTFSTLYGAEISLNEMLFPEVVKRYVGSGTGEKFLVKMN